MSLQDAFYTIGIIFMLFISVLVIAGIIVGVMLASRIIKFYNMFESRVEDVKEIIEHPRETAANVGAAVASTAFHQIRKITSSKKRRRSRRR